MDSNPTLQLSDGSVHGIYARHISLCFMPKLITVDQYAFRNLSKLMSLHLHSNPSLSYLHPHAFVDLDSLEALYLHNCSLSSLPFTLPSMLPSLHHVTLFANPLLCDCNSAWIWHEMRAKPDNRQSSSHFEPLWLIRILKRNMLRGSHAVIKLTL